jgi:hypothetical protein
MRIKKVDGNQAKLVKQMRKIPGLTVAHTHTVGNGFVDVIWICRYVRILYVCKKHVWNAAIFFTSGLHMRISGIAVARRACLNIIKENTRAKTILIIKTRVSKFVLNVAMSIRRIIRKGCIAQNLVTTIHPQHLNIEKTWQD